MAYTTIKKPSLYFNTKIYTGNASAGHAITGVGHSPNLVWIKSRSTGFDHPLFDTVRGVTKMLNPNQNYAESTHTNSLISFDSDGFTTDAYVATNASEGLVSWNWKAGTTSGLTTNGTTTITPTSYSFNSTSKFSILKYTGNGAAGAYVAHGLGATPAMIIVKKTSGTGGWFVYHHKLQSTYNIYLNTTEAEFGGAYVYSPDATNFRLRDHNDVNQSGQTYVAYCFKDVVGYSKFDSYTGNGNADGPFAYCGFKPNFVMIKRATSGTERWVMMDIKRDTFNVANKAVYADDGQGEVSSASEQNLDILSNGFKIRNSNTKMNTNAIEYIYMAFAAEPLVGDNPATAR